MLVYEESRRVAREVRRETGAYEDRSEGWVRHRQRIARLRPEIGEHLDALAVPFYLVRDVAYGWTRLEQERRYRAVVRKVVEAALRRVLRHRGEPLEAAVVAKIADEVIEKRADNKAMRAAVANVARAQRTKGADVVPPWAEVVRR